MGPLLVDSNTGDSNNVHVGRPRTPLLVGQRAFIAFAYTDRRYSQARIAEELGIAIPRVRRYLLDTGLYTPRPSHRTEARLNQLEDAVNAYTEGERVVTICQDYYVNPAELYRELRRRNVPLRTQHTLEATAPAATTVERR